jgi:hypothetical protein
LDEDLSGGALASGSFRLISSVYERLWSDIPPSEDESIFNKGFFGVRERNLCSSEPTPATGHRHRSVSYRKKRTSKMGRISESSMSPDDLDDWIQRHELTVEQAAETLGTTDRTIYAYLAGDRAIPQTVATLCEALG